MKSRTTLAALAAFALAGSAHAATIVWSSSVFLTDNTTPWAMVMGQFNKTGTKIFAENSGGGAESFDGINFTAPSVGVFDDVYGLFYDSGSPLAATGTYKNGNAVGTVNLTGLKSGYTYRIQALLFDSRTQYNGRTVLFDGINQGVYANGVADDRGDGLLVTGTFVADATETQSFTVHAREPGGVLLAGGQLNALTLYQTAIPEPSAALLGGLGLLALLRRRR